MALFERIAPETKRFNGKVFRFLEGHRTKSAAKEQAENQRRKGKKARVVKIANAYFVYTRG